MRPNIWGLSRARARRGGANNAARGRGGGAYGFSVDDARTRVVNRVSPGFAPGHGNQTGTKPVALYAAAIVSLPTRDSMSWWTVISAFFHSRVSAGASV